MRKGCEEQPFSYARVSVGSSRRACVDEAFAGLGVVVGRWLVRRSTVLVHVAGDFAGGDRQAAPPLKRAFGLDSEIPMCLVQIENLFAHNCLRLPSHVDNHQPGFLKRKVEAGAAAVLTQLFYDNTDFFRFRDAAMATGISVPIVPGIMPITKLSQIKRITSLCGARIPERLHDSLAAHEDGSADQQSAGIDYAIAQCRELLEGGVPGLHIFTLNSGHATSQIIHALHDYFDDGQAGSP